MPTEQELLKKFNAVATVSDAVPAPRAKPWLGDLVDSALQAEGHPAHLLFGEPHVNGSFLETFVMLAENPGVLGVAAKNGVRHLVLEFPVRFQQRLDTYARHECARDKFLWSVFDNPFYHFVTPWVSGDAAIQFQAAFAAVIDKALEAGLSVHFADLSSDTFLFTSPPEFAALETTLAERHREEKSPLPLQKYIMEYIQNLPPPEQGRLADIMTKFNYAQRQLRLDDTEQFNYLRERIPAGEGIIGLFGYAHLDDSIASGIGLNSHLEREGAAVTTVEIYNNRNTLDFMTETYRESGAVKGKLPDYTIILDEDALLDKNLAVVDRVGFGKNPPAAPPPVSGGPATSPPSAP